MRPKSDAIAWRDTVTKEAQQRREDWERLEAQRKRLEELRGERGKSEALTGRKAGMNVNIDGTRR